MNFIGQQDCGISIESDLQQTWNSHLAGPMYCFFLPEVSGTKYYRVDVDLDKLDLADSGRGKMLLSTSAKWLLEWIYTVGRNHETLFEEIDKIWMTEGMHNTVP